MAKLKGFCNNRVHPNFGNIIIHEFRPNLECDNKSCINCIFYMTLKQYKAMMIKLSSALDR